MIRARFILWSIAAAILIADSVFAETLALTQSRHVPTRKEQNDESLVDTSFGFPVRIAHNSAVVIGQDYGNRMLFLMIEDRYCSPDHLRVVFSGLAARYQENFLKIDVYSDPEMLRRAIARYKRFPDELTFPDTAEGEELERSIRGDLFIPKTGWARARYFKGPNEGERFFYKHNPLSVEMVEVIISPVPVPKYGGDLQADLFLACKLGDLPKVKALIDNGALVDYKDQDGQTALVYAVGHNKAQIANLLLMRGAYVDAKNKYGQTSLCEALSHGFHETFLVLLEHNADVNARYGSGISALHLAAYKGDEDAVEELLSKNADANATDGDGNTPLFDAIRTRKIRIIRALVQNGASLNVRNNHGQTPQSLANKTGDPAIIQLLRTTHYRLRGSC